jgi:hypothetical protein
VRTCSFRLQIASAAAMAVALMVCSSARADEPTDFYQALRQAFEWTLKDRSSGPRLTGWHSRSTSSPVRRCKPWWNACLAPRGKVVEVARQAIGQG